MGRCIIDEVETFLKKNIPGVLCAGMFFFSIDVQAGLLDLATDLFENGEWELCRRECRRARLDRAAPRERFQLLEALCAVRMDAAPRETLETLHTLMAEHAGTQLAAIAALEAGRLHWRFGQPRAAVSALSAAFGSATNKTLFLHSACSLFLLFKDYPELKEGRDDLVLQINTSRSEWYGALFKECARPERGRAATKAPNGLVRFYRSQIGPAIGNRCALDPSCSEYFNQAVDKHGLKAIPMIADRFVREPEVSNAKAVPVMMEGGRIRYRDPLEAHDFWMKQP